MGPSAMGLLQSPSSLMCLVANCVCTMEKSRPIHTPWGLSTYRGLLTGSKWPPPLILKADLCRLWHQGSFDFREREHCQHPCKGGEWTPLPHSTMFLEHLSPTSLTLSVQSARRLVVGNHSPWRNGRGPLSVLSLLFCGT